MSAIHRILLILIVIAAILATGCTQPAPEPQPAAAEPVMNVTVPFAPIPVFSQDDVNLA